MNLNKQTIYRNIAPGLGWLNQIIERSNHKLEDISRIIRFLKGRLEFIPRSSDIYIVTYPRSGTTWLQYILYLMTTEGNTNFNHIGEVTPWWERSIAVGRFSASDYNKLDSPRIFKSHLPKRWLPDKGRYIYISRDGRDVAYSYYRLYTSHLGFQGTFVDFFEQFIKGNLQYGSWFKHVAAWNKQVNNPRVMLLRFEEMKKSTEDCIKKIAAFCRIPLSNEQILDVCQKSSIESMKSIEHKFDHIGELLAEKKILQNAFIRQGTIGNGISQLTEAQLKKFKKMSQKDFLYPEFEWNIAEFLH